MRVQPVRGGPDQRHRRRERRSRPRSTTRSPLTVALSTDKAVNPVNLYGATKLCAEKIVAQADVYAPAGASRFASVRYGNVVGSRGSVVPIFKQQAATGVLTITDERMTRFWITLEAGGRVRAQLDGAGARRRDVRARRSRACGSSTSPRRWRPRPSCAIVGIRPGEKLHEVLLTEDEARHVLRPRRPLRDHAVAADLGGRAPRRAASRCPTASATPPTTTTVADRRAMLAMTDSVPPGAPARRDRPARRGRRYGELSAEREDLEREADPHAVCRRRPRGARRSVRGSLPRPASAAGSAPGRAPVVVAEQRALWPR